MEWISLLFGSGTELNALQMSCRAVLAFFITLILIRIAGVRVFGKKSPFDNVVIIMLGSILSRAVVGASPFIATCVACLAFSLIHWLLGKLSVHYDKIGRLVKGDKKILYANGRENKKNMDRAHISQKDLEEGIRLRINADSLEHVKEIYIERNGEISIVKKDSTA